MAAGVPGGRVRPRPGQLRMMGFKKAYLNPAHRLNLLRSISPPLLAGIQWIWSRAF